MKAFYSDHFVLPLPPRHRFPMEKYARLRARVAHELPAVQLCEPEAASDGELALAHEPGYIDRLDRGLLSAAEQRRIGFPWSPQMVERSRRSVGATIAACRVAAEDGIAVNLAGGTHHAHAAHGEGFCCFNDVAVAARLMQAEGRAHQVLIVDLDVHQGDGTAAILGGDPGVFTLSLHGERNFPFRKARSSLDVALADGTGDAAYLRALAQALDRVQARFEADFVIFVAGADVYERDRLGR
ncbi:MAG: histone deacetylase, partial [Burkholderiales bacterium]